MSTSFDSDGADRLQCVGPPDDDDFAPTAMCALAPQGDEAPTLTFGVADFSIEVWLQWAQGNDSPGADVTCWLGALQPTGGPPFTHMLHGAALRISPDVFTVRAFYDETLGGVGVNTLSWTVTAGLWHHFLMNYDRSGNLDVYMDGDLARSIAINANAMAACSIWPYTSLELDPRNDRQNNTDGADWYSNIVSRMWQGPFAVHNRLLTAAEIEESRISRMVQNISGVTQILWDPKNVEGHTGWESREDYICSLDRGLLHLPFGAPEGDYGTVVIADSSGNGRDLNLPVASEYQNERAAGVGLGTTSRARCCFIADPWWK